MRVLLLDELHARDAHAAQTIDAPLRAAAPHDGLLVRPEAAHRVGALVGLQVEKALGRLGVLTGGLRLLTLLTARAGGLLNEFVLTGHRPPPSPAGARSHSPRRRSGTRF